MHACMHLYLSLSLYIYICTYIYIYTYIYIHISFSNTGWNVFEFPWPRWNESVLWSQTLRRSPLVQCLGSNVDCPLIRKSLKMVWVFPKIGGKPPKWMVYFMEHPLNMGWFGFFSPIFGSTHLGLQDFCFWTSKSFYTAGKGLWPLPNP